MMQMQYYHWYDKGISIPSNEFSTVLAVWFRKVNVIKVF